MEEAVAVRYWCHSCSRNVSLTDVEVEMKCPNCDSDFVEEIGPSWEDRRDFHFGSEGALSLLSPMLLGVMGRPRRPRRPRLLEFGNYDEEEDEDEDEDEESYHERRPQLHQRIESIIWRRRRRRRSSATVLQLPQDIRARMASEYESGDQERDVDGEGDNDRDREWNRDMERGHLIMIDPVNQALIIRGYGHFPSQNSNTIGSLGNYFVGPGLDMLLQHLAENNPNRYGTPPARKEAVEAMPAVTIEEKLQCSVCLDDFEIGAEAREMPCDHKFHAGCILPWLELHSSCPVCRYLLPSDESKISSDGSISGSTQMESRREREIQGEREREMELEREREIQGEREREMEREREREREKGKESEGGHGSSEEVDGEGRNGNGRRFSFGWPFQGFFSPFSQSAGGNASSSSSSSSAGHTHESTSQTKEN